MYRRSTKTPARTDWRRVIRSRSFAVTMIIGIAILSVSLAKEIIRKVQIRQQISELEREIGTLEQHNQELNNLLAYFNSSTFQEKEAKVKLNLTAPGETVVVLPDTGLAAEAESTAVAISNSEPTSNVQKWINYFFN